MRHLFILVFLLMMFLNSGIFAQSVFQITTNTENTNSHITTIDRIETNGKEKAIIVVTAEYGAYINAPLGVWYSEGKWKIYTEDRSPIPLNTIFNVLVMESGRNAYRVAKGTNRQESFFTLESVDKSMVALVTHVYGVGLYNESRVGAYINNGSLVLYNDDGKVIPDGMVFNVIYVSNVQGANAFIHRNASSSHISDLAKPIDQNQILFTTPSMERQGVINARNTGVWWNGTNWTIYNQNMETMPTGIIYNVAAFEKNGVSFDPVIPSQPFFIPDLVFTLPAEKFVEATESNLQSKPNVKLPFIALPQTLKYVNHNGRKIMHGDIKVDNQIERRTPNRRAQPKRVDLKAKYDNQNYGDVSSSSAALTAIEDDANIFGRYNWFEDLWIDGTIPYQFDSDFSDAEIATIEGHLQSLTDRTNLTLVRRDQHEDYIHFERNFDESVGWSCLGRQGGEQEIALGSTNRGHVIHEVLHAAGFYHEQSRPDRDDFVEILWGNIGFWDEHNFDKHEDSRPLTPYDFYSLMHYGRTGFGDGETTIRRADGTNGPIGRGNDMTELDIAGINTLYVTDFENRLPPPTSVSRGISVEVDRFEVKRGEDGCGEVEFESIIEIKEGMTWRLYDTENSGALKRNGSEREGRILEGRELDTWQIQYNVPRNAIKAKVLINVVEVDGWFCGDDDPVDINPSNNFVDLILEVDLRYGTIYTWDPRISQPIDFLGRVNEDITVQGFQTEFQGDEDVMPGAITFRIDLTD